VRHPRLHLVVDRFGGKRQRLFGEQPATGQFDLERRLERLDFRHDQPQREQRERPRRSIPGLFRSIERRRRSQPDDFFRFFCIDISQFVDGGPDAYVRSLGVPDATKAAELSRLFDLFYPNASANTYYAGGQTNFGDFPDATTSAAFQLALWEVWFDTNLDLGSGVFTATSSAAGLAQTYLNAVAAGSGTAPDWTFFEFTNSRFQDYLSVEHTTTLRSAPEPALLVLLCSAALAAWAPALRRRQTA
jgi:hypothetical protein